MKYLLVYRHIISKITSDEIFEEIYLKKLNNITNIINNENLNFCKIKYLTIVVIGETGVGKSTLIINSFNNLSNNNLSKKLVYL